LYFTLVSKANTCILYFTLVSKANTCILYFTLVLKANTCILYFTLVSKDNTHTSDFFQQLPCKLYASYVKFKHGKTS
jgi:predicted secreted protein